MQSTSALRGRSLSSQQLRNRRLAPQGARAVYQPAWRLSRRWSERGNQACVMPVLSRHALTAASGS